MHPVTHSAVKCLKTCPRREAGGREPDPTCGAPASRVPLPSSVSHGPIRNKGPHPTELLQTGKNREETQLPRGSVGAESIQCGTHSSCVIQILKLKLCIARKPAYRCVWHAPSNCQDLEAPRCPLLSECAGELFCPALKRNEPSGHAKTQRNKGSPTGKATRWGTPTV